MLNYKRLYALTLIGLVSASLTACATPSTGDTAVLLPPREYLHDCIIPTLGETNAALAEYARAAKDSLIDCNVDKAALRAWRETASGVPDPTMQ